MSLIEELELVPPENRHDVEEEYNRGNATAQIEEAREMCRGMAQRHVPIYEVRCGAVTNNFDYQKRLVYVTFYTHLDKKVVQMHLDDRHCLEQVTQKAVELLPTVQWKICSGTQHQSDFEFQSSRQVWDSIKRSPICRFYYLLVRLERLYPVKTHDAKCDNCRQFIIGHRYKCTECADFDICQSCEGRSVHREHAMLRLVDSATHVPKYITDNAPRYVFDQFNGY